MFPAIVFAFLFHVFITVSVKNDPFDYVVQASSSSWLQEHMLDLSERYYLNLLLAILFSLLIMEILRTNS